MDQSCADQFYATFEEFKADGGKVEGIVEWVADPEEAKKVCSRSIFLFPFLVLAPFLCLTFFAVWIVTWTQGGVAIHLRLILAIISYPNATRNVSSPCSQLPR